MANQVKQSALASDLRVTQAAISRWENGRDIPTTTKLAHLLNIMRKHSPYYLVETSYIKRLHSMRALFAFDGIRLLVSSYGMKQAWPEFAQMENYAFGDTLVDESAVLFNDGDVAYHMRQGNPLLISGVSDRHVTLEVDSAYRHRWHACLRRIDGQSIVDISFESCPDHTPVGIEDIFYPDKLTAL